MSLTKIGSIGINTGIQLAGVTTVSTLHVGSGVTLSSDGDIFATGVTTSTTFIGALTGNVTGDVTGAATQITVADESSDTSAFVVFTNTATGNNAPKTGSNLTFNSSSGALTATSFVGSGANLTGIDTDLLSDTTPQLGGNLDVNSKAINFGDSNGSTTNLAQFGADTDLRIYHEDGVGNVINSYSSNAFKIFTNGNTEILTSNAETCAKFIKNGAVELYYDNSKIFETGTDQATITGKLTINRSSNDEKLVLSGSASPYIRFQETTTNKAYMQWSSNGYIEIYNSETSKGMRVGGQGVEVLDDIKFTAGDSQDLRIYHSGSWNYIQNYESKNFALQVKDTENAIVAIPDGSVQLYHDNVLKFDTVSTGIRVWGVEGGDAQIQLLADEGDDNADYWRFLAGAAGQLDVANYSTGSWINHMTINGNGIMTRPKTPSFSAHTTATTAADTEVVFGAAVTTIGNHYSTSTGRFTAPVAGNYFFSFHGMGPFATSNNARCHFRINGAVHGGGQHYGGVGYSGDTGDYTHVSMDTILPLSANDYVTVYWEYMPLHAEHNKFNGFLIG